MSSARPAAFGQFEELTIARLADEISSKVGTTKPEVQRTTEIGQPTLLVESTDGFKLLGVERGAAATTPGNRREEHRRAFTEYDAEVDIEAHPSSEVASLPTASTSVGSL